MASDLQVFADAFYRERRTQAREATQRVCTVCLEQIRSSDPKQVRTATSGFGHRSDCHSFDYGNGLGLGFPAGPGRPLRADVFWGAFLARRGDNRAIGQCRTCEGIVLLADPADVRELGERDGIGHDADCQALVFANTLGLGGDPPGICMFGSSLPVFGSSELWFGTTCGESGGALFGSNNSEFGSTELVFGQA